MITQVPDEIAEIMRESAAEKSAMVNRNSEGKVTAVRLKVGADYHALRIRLSEWCDEPAVADLGPVELYQRVVTGKAKCSEVQGIIRAGLKGAQRGMENPMKVGPILDALVDDYPFSTAVQIAETTLAAWLVGIDPPAEEA